MHLQAELEERGHELLAEPVHRLAPLTAVRVPEGLDGRNATVETADRVVAALDTVLAEERAPALA